jgi:hypothetical protein
MIRWLVQEACGLKWDDACLRFYHNGPHRQRCPVRQPIFLTALDRWRRYEAISVRCSKRSDPTRRVSLRQLSRAVTRIAQR